MSIRCILFLAALLPVFALAQGPSTQSKLQPPNAPTLAVLLANRPDLIPKEQWLGMMQEPVNRSLYPLRVTHVMLDTIDARQLDLRYQYVMVKEETTPVGEQKIP